MSPAIGRSFSPDEQIPGHANVSVISYHLWRTKFGGDPQILGRNLASANGDKHTVIGVMPLGFSFPDKTDIWTPREVGEFFKTKARQYPNQKVIGRLNPAVTWAQAQTELDVIAGRLAAQYPAIDGGVGVHVVPLRRQLSQKVRQGLIVLWGAIAGVLLIACLNAANLILARAAGRAKEISVRYSLGATRGRIIRQFQCESFLLASIAAAAGILLAIWILNLVSKLNPDLAKLERLRLQCSRTRLHRCDHGVHRARLRVAPRAFRATSGLESRAARNKLRPSRSWCARGPKIIYCRASLARVRSACRLRLASA